MDPSLLLTLGLIVIGVILIGVLFTFVPITLWISALAAGVRISIFTLIGMRLRRVSPNRIINPLIKAHKAGLGVTINQLESHYLAGGNVDRVVNALIAAERANIELSFERCAAIDLAGRDVLEAVQAGWDGTKNGSEQPPGVYFWKVKGEVPSGQLLLNGKDSGSIVLIR
mgnify:CR=1 FL=1